MYLCPVNHPIQQLPENMVNYVTRAFVQIRQFRDPKNKIDCQFIGF